MIKVMLSKETNMSKGTCVLSDAFKTYMKLFALVKYNFIVIFSRLNVLTSCFTNR